MASVTTASGERRPLTGDEVRQQVAASGHVTTAAAAGTGSHAPALESSGRAHYLAHSHGGSGGGGGGGSVTTAASVAPASSTVLASDGERVTVVAAPATAAAEAAAAAGTGVVPAAFRAIVPGLYVGRVADTRDPALWPWVAAHVHHLGVLVDRMGPRQDWVTAAPLMSSKCYFMGDHYAEGAMEHLEEAMADVHKYRAAGKTVMLLDRYCNSAAPAVAVAYLLRHGSAHTLRTALDTVLAAVPTATLSHEMLHLLVDAAMRWGSTVTDDAMGGGGGGGGCGDGEGGGGGSAAAAAAVPPDPVRVRLAHVAALAHTAPLAFSMPPPPGALLAGVDRAELLAALFKKQQQEWQDATYLIPHLWVGNEPAARSVHWLRVHGIRALLNCAVEVDAPEPAFLEAAGVSDTCELQIVEHHSFDATPQLLRGADFIAAMIADGKGVLVNCFMGINRSVSTIATYLMKYHRLSLLEALTFIRTKRRIAYPNPEMYPRLLAAEAALHDGAASLTLDEMRSLHSWY